MPDGAGMAHGPHDDNMVEHHQPQYGPKQVMKPGELGNYEPRDYQLRSGPGQ